MGQVVKYVPSLSSYVVGSAISGYGSIQSNIGETISDIGESGNFIASAMQYRGTVEPVRKEIGEFIELIQNKVEDFVDDRINTVNAIRYWTPKAIRVFSMIAGRPIRFFYFNDISTNLHSVSNSEDLSAPLNNAIETTQNYLAALTDDSDLVSKFDTTFGDNWNVEVANLLIQSWSENNFTNIPEIKIVSSAEIAGNSGAYELSSGDIYLAKEFIAENANDTDLIASVILEEIGHHVDSLINTVNAPGDEGEIFSALVRSEDLSQQRLQELQTEDDLGTVINNTVLWDTVGAWSEEAWDASAEWSDEAWDAIAHWSETDWQDTTEWTDEQWQETTEWTEEEWIETIDELFPLQVADWRQTATGYVIQFNEQIDLDSLKLFTQQPNITLTGQTDSPVDGYYVWDEDSYYLTFVKTGGLLESNIYNLRIACGETGLLSELGTQLDGNGDRNEGDDYSKIFATTTNTNDLVLGLPDLTVAPGETTEINLSLDNNNFEDINKVELDLYYDPDLLDISSLEVADNLPIDWQLTDSQIDEDSGIVSITIEGDNSLFNSSLNLLNIEATVPENTGNKNIAILDLENISVNNNSLNVLDDDSIQILDNSEITDISMTSNDEQADPEIFIHSVVSQEPESSVDELRLRVHLSEASSENISVDYSTADLNKIPWASAIAGEDYVATSGTLNFAPGETEKTIAIELLSDSQFEPDESFEVNLSNAINAEITDNVGLVYIDNFKVNGLGFSTEDEPTNIEGLRYDSDDNNFYTYNNQNYYYHFYSLADYGHLSSDEPINLGDTIKITASSDAFDPMLMILDGEGNVIDMNDNISPDNTTAELIYTVGNEPFFVSVEHTEDGFFGIDSFASYDLYVELVATEI